MEKKLSEKQELPKTQKTQLVQRPKKLTAEGYQRRYLKLLNPTSKKKDS